MIIVRSPLRITLGGGGTDLPSFYEKHQGFLIAAAINKYIYVILTKPFEDGIYLKYSSAEKTTQVKNIKHPIIREALIHENLNNEPIELTTLADIPSGTGLGSSGSFATALIKAIQLKKKKNISKKVLAETAFFIEMKKLNEPVGKQDHFISSYGGIRCFSFMKNNNVKTNLLKISNENLKKFKNNLILFYTGFSRASKKILINQRELSLKNDKNMIKSLIKTKEMGYKIKYFLEKNDFESFGYLMNEHWNEKIKRSEFMSNTKINEWYKGALKNGAIGGKLVGAGGGGFLLFYAKDKNKLKHYFSKFGIEELFFEFDFEGTKKLTL
jgi:D-glycero-alpha-D-manno-heptose-7-phosphate kinase